MGLTGFCLGGPSAREDLSICAGGVRGQRAVCALGSFWIACGRDMRLKAFRKGEQFVEFLVLLSAKYDLNRRQLKHMVV